MLGRLALGLALGLGASLAMAADMQWGVNGHPITAYPGVSADQQLDLVKGLGATSYRVNISNRDQADALAEVVAAAKVRGIAVLPVLTPEVDMEKEAPAELYEAAYDFAVALGSRFKEDIGIWELGNELENYAIIQPCEQRDDGTIYPCDWGPAGGRDALDYYGPRWTKVSAVLRGLSDGIIAVDPALRKAIGSAGWGHLGSFSRMQSDRIAWDISVWHQYGEDPEWAFEVLQTYGRPIWVTELNFPYGSRDGEAEQAEGLSQAMSRLVELSDRYGVEAAYIYELLDEPYWAPSFEAQMGLVRMKATDGGGWTPATPKPAYDAAAATIVKSAPRRCSLRAVAEIGPVADRQANYAACLLFGDTADTALIEHWSTALSTGGTTAIDMLRAMMASPAFRAKYDLASLSDAEYVDFVYRMLLGREPDGYGRQSYADQLASGGLTRDAMARAGLESNEFAARHPELFRSITAKAEGPKRSCDLEAAAAGSEAERPVRYAHCLLVGRDATEAEIVDWTARLTTGSGTGDLIAALFASDEFASRNQTTMLTDRDYVGLVYRLLLGRDVDGKGGADYVHKISRGSLSREGMALEITQSAEFAARNPVLVPAPEPEATYAPPPRDCDLNATQRLADPVARRVAYAYCLVLGSDPDPASLEAWRGKLSSGTVTMADLLVALYRSPSFAQRYGPETLSDREYVELVYNVFLDRDADLFSLEDYVRQLRDGSLARDNVALGALTSNEFMSRHRTLVQ